MKNQDVITFCSYNKQVGQSRKSASSDVLYKFYKACLLEIAKN